MTMLAWPMGCLVAMGAARHSVFDHKVSIYVWVCNQLAKMLCQCDKMGVSKPGDQATWKPCVLQGMGFLCRHAINDNMHMPVRGDCVPCADAETTVATNSTVQKWCQGGDDGC